MPTRTCTAADASEPPGPFREGPTRDCAEGPGCCWVAPSQLSGDDHGPEGCQLLWPLLPKSASLPYSLLSHPLAKLLTWSARRP